MSIGNVHCWDLLEEKEAPQALNPPRVRTTKIKIIKSAVIFPHNELNNLCVISETFLH